MRVMPKKKHQIKLSAAERELLQKILDKGHASALRQRHARILLLADSNGPEGDWSDGQIAHATQTSIPTVERVRRICVEHGLERALERKDPERSANSTARLRQRSSRCAVASRQKVRCVGRCGSWPGGWWNWRWWIRSATRRCVEL